MKKDEIQLVEENENLDVVQENELEDVVGGFEVRSAQLIGTTTARDIVICVSGC